MASVSKRQNKRTGRTEYYVQFYDHARKNRKVYGFLRESYAMRFADQIEKLVRYRRNDEEPDNKLSEWLDSLSDHVYGNLSNWGLVTQREIEFTLIDLSNLFLNKTEEARLKPSSIRHFRTVFRFLFEYFGEDCPLRAITPAKALEFNAKYSAKYASTSWSHFLEVIKRFFNHAKKRGWINSSPFADIKKGSMTNPARMAFISNETISVILGFCRNSQERLIICLARYGGLRIPSEIQYMKWSDVDFQNNRLLVKAPKKETWANEQRGIFTSKSQRYIPLFPELRKAFLDYKIDFPSNGPEFLFDHGDKMPKRFRVNNLHKNNLRSIVFRALKKAGIEPWPRLYHNMRSTRETELLHSGLPIKDVCSIIGNTPEIAMKHYIQVSWNLFSKCSAQVTNPDFVGVSVGVNQEKK